MLAIVIGQELKIMGLCLLFRINTRTCPQVSGKEYTNFQEHYVDMYNVLMFTKSYGEVLKSTQSFVDNAPTDTNAIMK